MNLRGYILGTVAANLALVAALLWQVAQLPAPAARGGVSVTTNFVNEVVHEPSPRPAVVSVPGSPPFRWEQLESTNHLQFLTNLLAIGCPLETARDILDARVADDFRARMRELTRPLQARFWDAVVAAGKLDEMFKEPELEKQIEALKTERKRVQAGVWATIGEGETKVEKLGRNEQFAHLSDEKQAEIAELAGRHTKEREALNRELAKAPPAERTAKQKELRDRQQTERRTLFTDEAWTESELRSSPQARQVRELRGFTATADELRELAVALRGFDNANPRPTREPNRPADDPDFKAKQGQHEDRRKAFLAERLGEAAFAAFERGSDPRFHTLLKLARRLEMPSAAAAQWLELQTAAQEQARQLQQNNELAGDARAVALLAIRAETERALQTAVGLRGWGAYQRHAGDWLKDLRPAAP
jgi:hypothetical protein